MKKSLFLIPVCSVLPALSHCAEASVPELKGPFTAVYDVAKTERMTRALMEDSLAALKMDLHKAAKARPSSVARIESILKSTREYYENQLTSQRGENYRLVVSSNGKALLVRRDNREPSAGEAGVKSVALVFAGSQFIRGMPNTGSFRSAHVGVGLEEAPFVGASLPNLPFQNGEGYLETSSVQVKGLKYVPGRLESEKVGDRTRIHRLILGPKGEEKRDFVLTDYRTLGDAGIAGRVQVSDRYHGVDPKLNGTVFSTAVYRLVDLKPSSLPAEEFTPNHYLTTGESVTVDGPTGFQDAIKFDATKGSLLDQLEEARLKETLSASRRTRSKSSAATAGLLMMAGLVGIGGYVGSRMRRGRA